MAVARGPATARRRFSLRSVAVVLGGSARPGTALLSSHACLACTCRPACRGQRGLQAHAAARWAGHLRSRLINANHRRRRNPRLSLCVHGLSFAWFLMVWVWHTTPAAAHLPGAQGFGWFVRCGRAGGRAAPQHLPAGRQGIQRGIPPHGAPWQSSRAAQPRAPKVRHRECSAGASCSLPLPSAGFVGAGVWGGAGTSHSTATRCRRSRWAWPWLTASAPR